MDSILLTPLARGADVVEAADQESAPGAAHQAFDLAVIHDAPVDVDLYGGTYCRVHPTGEIEFAPNIRAAVA